MSESMSEVQKTLTIEERLAKLEADNLELRDELQHKTEAIMRKLVEISAEQIQMLLENPVMAASIASNLLTTLQNALLYQAHDSKNRRPTALIVSDWIPGAYRISLSEEGVLSLDLQETETHVLEEQVWTPYQAILDNPELTKVFVDLAKSYNLDAGQVAYVTDDLKLKAHRDQLSEKISQAAARIN